MRSLAERFTGFVRYVYRTPTLYLMMVPGLLLLVAVRYMPIFGLIVAFKEYSYVDGIFGSPWNGFANFGFFFSSRAGWRAIANTLTLNLTFIAVHTVAQITMALILNEIPYMRYKKIAQSLIFFPFFISWIVVSVFAYNLFNYEYGSINRLLVLMDLERIAFYELPQLWPVILAAVDTWHWLGYGMIIFLAILSGISPEYYEAAAIDGATRFQQVRYISIPFLLPTATILTLLSIGRILNADFGMFYGLIGENSLLYETSDVLDTFVYRNLRVLGDVGMSAAASFFQSAVGFTVVLLSNAAARRYQAEGALF